MKIKVPFKEVKKVAHIADVHIRLFKRHDEYKEVLERLYQQLKLAQLEQGVIVVAGDIVHAKTDMSPELIAFTSEFFKNLADIAPTIIIAGNHDLNLANTGRLDSLSPIVDLISHPNLHYLRESQIATIADTDFAVFSIVDGKEHWPSVTDCKSKNKVALYHGPVYGANAGGNFTVTSRHVEVSEFNGFDVVMLGDIHTYQVLQDRDATEKKPVIAYASSIIQQNHGEFLENHGWCLWNMSTYEHIFIETQNDYGFYTFECTPSAQVPKLFLKNLRLRIFTGDTDSVTVKKIIAEFKKNYNVVELTTNKHRYDGIVRPKSAKHTELLDVTNVNIQNSLISEYLNKVHPEIEDSLVESILKINTTLNGELKHEDYSRCIQWRPIEFTFSNMFSYGENNKINFDNMKGLYGIFAPNASGKSSIMDSLMFCLYDKTPRATSARHVINNRKNTFDCKLVLQISNTIYVIKKHGTKNKKGEVKVDVEFLRQEQDGTFTSLTGQERRDTNSIIKSYVGTYEDFVLTTFTNNTSNALFIDTAHSERKDLLSQFMGLDIFDKLNEVANDESKMLAGAIKRFNKNDETDKLAQTENTISVLQDKVQEVQGRQRDLEIALESQQEIKDRLLQQLLSIETPAHTISELEDQQNKTMVRIADIQEKLDTLADKMVVITEQIKQKKNELAKFDHDALVKELDKLLNLKNQLDSLTNAKVQLERQILETERLVAKLASIQYNKNCEVCVENNQQFIDELQSSKVKLEQLHKELLLTEVNISDIVVTAPVDLNSVREQIKLSRELSDNITLLQTEYSKCELSIEKGKGLLEKEKLTSFEIEKEVAQVLANQEAITHNSKVKVELEAVNTNIVEAKSRLDKVRAILLQTSTDCKVQEAARDSILKYMEEMTEIESKFTAYKYYLETTNREGIPRMLLTKVIPTIENEINNILSQMVGFTITLDMEGKNINAYLNYDHERIWPLENCSGMERFVSGLAMRVALLNASNLPKSNFLLIDEGFGTLDSDNLASMQTLFNMLKTQFDFIFIVSHLDTARDMVDNSIEIKRKEGYSYITV
jgi:DNA repair exonuclease SbcCD ATPase subunit/DNA repair exonuclease SbcCD nuclease subunit